MNGLTEMHDLKMTDHPNHRGEGGPGEMQDLKWLTKLHGMKMTDDFDVMVSGPSFSGPAISGRALSCLVFLRFALAPV